MRTPLLLDPIQPYDQPSRDALALPHAAVDLICSVLDGSGWTGSDRRDQVAGLRSHDGVPLLTSDGVTGPRWSHAHKYSPRDSNPD